MADIISRLKLESGEFDSKIKRAGQELMAYSEHCRKTGLVMGFANKDARDFAQSLGSMQTTSTTARGKINELSDAFVNLRMMYKQMTDEEKNNQFGKNLAASLDQLKTRIMDAKKELADVTAELNGASSGGKGGFLSGIGNKMGGAMQVFAGNVMTKAAGVGVDLAMEMADMVKQGVELARQGEGIRIAFERLGRGDILDGLREATHGTVTDLELMKAAVKFNDFKLPLDELGTMLAFAQQKAKDTGQSVDYMVDSIVTGLGRKSLMILDNLGLSASEIKERMAETGDMTKAVGEIIRDQMSKAGDYVETAADRAAQANVSLQNKMEELGRKFAPVEEASNQLWTSMKIGILDIIGGPLARLLNDLTEAGRLKNALNDINGDGSNGAETRSGKALRILREYSGGGRGIEGKRELYDRQVTSFQNQEEKEWRKANRLRDELAGLRRKQRENGAAGNLQPLIDDTTRQLEAAESRAKAFQIAKNEYVKGAKDILKPVNVNVNTNQAEQNVASLRRQLNELEEQRKKAIAADDTELSKNLAKQISQVKSDIKGLGGSSTSKGRNTTKKEQTELQQNQKRINDLTQKYVDLMSEASRESKPLTNEQRDRAASIKKEIRDLERRNGQLKLYQEQAQGKLLGPDAFRQQLEVDVAVNNKKIEELEKQLLSLDGITIDPKTVTITATDEALPKLREIQGITIDDKTMTVTADTMEALRAVQGINGVTINPKTVTITATDDALPKLREIQGITIDDKTMTVTAQTADALRALQGIDGVTIDPKTVTITATDEALPKLREIDGITIDDKTMTVTAQTADALRALQGIDGVTIDPKTVTITATDDALPKLREIQGITVDDKTMTVTAQTADALRALQGIEGITVDPKTMSVTAATQEALQALQAVEGVTIDTKNVKVTAETDEARQKVEELKRQIAELKDQNIQITAAMSSIGMPLSETPRMGVTDVAYGKGKNQFVPAPLMPSMDDVVRQRGGNLLDEKAMKAVNEDIGRNLPKDNETDKRDDPLKEAKKQNQYLEGIGSDISGMLSGLEKMGIEIPEGLSSVVGGIQMISGIVSSILTLVGVISALTSVKSVPIFGWLLAQGGIAGGLGGRHPIHAAGGTVVGNTYSGDQIPAMLNAGEVVLNRAQQGNIASQLENGASQNLKLDAVISGEQIRMVLNNNGRRTGRGEYVTSNRR